MAPGISVTLNVPAARPGQEVEATVYLHRAAAAVKVEALAKPEFLNLAWAAPLPEENKDIISDPEQWQLSSTEDGHTSVWYAGKLGGDGSKQMPVLRLRWRLSGAPPAGKLAINFKVTAVGPDGEMSSQALDLPIILLGSDPKIDDVQPRLVPNDVDTVLTIRGSNFLATPKVYLVAGDVEIQLIEVAFAPDIDQFVWATVPAGTKVGAYKVRLINPDQSSVEFDGIRVAEPGFRLFVPVARNG